MMSACPNEDQLRRLLLEQPDAVEIPDVRAHVAGCPECRLHLAALAGQAGDPPGVPGETIAAAATAPGFAGGSTAPTWT